MTVDEIIDAMARAIEPAAPKDGRMYQEALTAAHTAFAIADRAIREQCAEEANQAWLDGVPYAEIANALRNPRAPANV